MPRKKRHSQTDRKPLPTRWGKWELDFDSATLQNPVAGMTIDLSGIQGTRSLWQTVAELVVRDRGDVVDPAGAIQALAVIFAPPSICSRPGILRPSDVVGLLEALRAGTLNPPKATTNWLGAGRHPLDELKGASACGPELS